MDQGHCQVYMHRSSFQTYRAIVAHDGGDFSFFGHFGSRSTILRLQVSVAFHPGQLGLLSSPLRCLFLSPGQGKSSLVFCPFDGCFRIRIAFCLVPRFVCWIFLPWFPILVWYTIGLHGSVMDDRQVRSASSVGMAAWDASWTTRLLTSIAVFLAHASTFLPCFSLFSCVVSTNRSWLLTVCISQGHDVRSFHVAFFLRMAHLLVSRTCASFTCTCVVTVRTSDVVSTVQDQETT